MEYFRDSSVPQYYKDITGSECKFCGSSYIVNSTRTVVKCCNPYCRRILAGQLKKIIDIMGIKGYGIESCLKIVDSKRYKTVIDFLTEPPIELRESINLLINKTTQLQDAINILSIPEFDENANKLFSKYRCMEDMLVNYDEEGTLSFEVMKVFGDGKLYENISNIIEEHMEELFQIDTVFNFDRPEITQIKHNVDICVTGEVRSSILSKLGVSIRTRRELVDFLNQQYNKEGYRFNLKDSVTSSVSFVVCDDEQSDTTKTRAGRTKGILTSTDNMIASIMNHINKKNEVSNGES